MESASRRRYMVLGFDAILKFFFSFNVVIAVFSLRPALCAAPSMYDSSWRPAPFSEPPPHAPCLATTFPLERASASREPCVGSLAHVQKVLQSKRHLDPHFAPGYHPPELLDIPQQPKPYRQQILPDRGFGEDGRYSVLHGADEDEDFVLGRNAVQPKRTLPASQSAQVGFEPRSWQRNCATSYEKTSPDQQAAPKFEQNAQNYQQNYQSFDGSNYGNDALNVWNAQTTGQLAVVQPPPAQDHESHSARIESISAEGSGREDEESPDEVELALLRRRELLRRRGRRPSDGCLSPPPGPIVDIPQSALESQPPKVSPRGKGFWEVDGAGQWRWVIPTQGCPMGPTSPINPSSHTGPTSPINPSSHTGPFVGARFPDSPRPQLLELGDNANSWPIYTEGDNFAPQYSSVTDAEQNPGHFGSAHSGNLQDAGRWARNSVGPQGRDSSPSFTQGYEHVPEYNRFQHANCAWSAENKAGPSQIIPPTTMNPIFEGADYQWQQNGAEGFFVKDDERAASLEDQRGLQARISRRYGRLPKALTGPDARLETEGSGDIEELDEPSGRDAAQSNQANFADGNQTFIDEMKKNGMPSKLESGYEGRLLYESQMEWYCQAAMRGLATVADAYSLLSRMAGAGHRPSRNMYHGLLRILETQVDAGKAKLDDVRTALNNMVSAKVGLDSATVHGLLVVCLAAAKTGQASVADAEELVLQALREGGMIDPVSNPLILAVALSAASCGRFEGVGNAKEVHRLLDVWLDPVPWDGRTSQQAADRSSKPPLSKTLPEGRQELAEREEMHLGCLALAMDIMVVLVAAGRAGFKDAESILERTQSKGIHPPAPFYQALLHAARLSGGVGGGPKKVLHTCEYVLDAMTKAGERPSRTMFSYVMQVCAEEARHGRASVMDAERVLGRLEAVHGPLVPASLIPAPGHQSVPSIPAGWGAPLPTHQTPIL